jgi:hypothetical protein
MTTTTSGIEGLYVETRNYGATAAFWASLGFEKRVDGQDGSSQWVRPAGGPYVFIIEQLDREPRITPVLRIEDAGAFNPDRPAVYVQPFQLQHWGVVQAVIADPDGRGVSIEAAATSSPADGADDA